MNILIQIRNLIWNMHQNEQNDFKFKILWINKFRDFKYTFLLQINTSNKHHYEKLRINILTSYIHLIWTIRMYVVFCYLIIVTTHSMLFFK